MPAMVPRGHVAFVRNVHQDPGQEFQGAQGLGARRRRAVRLVRPVGDRFRRPVVGEPLQRDGMPRAVPREPGGEGVWSPACLPTDALALVPCMQSPSLAWCESANRGSTSGVYAHYREQVTHRFQASHRSSF